VVGLAGGEEEHPARLAGVQLQAQPHRARGVRQWHLHEAVPKERSCGEEGERHLASRICVGAVNLQPLSPPISPSPFASGQGAAAQQPGKTLRRVCFSVFIFFSWGKVFLGAGCVEAEVVFLLAHVALIATFLLATWLRQMR